MTDEELRVAIAEWCGVSDRWVIMKYGLYYRPNACGYTDDIRQAWVVSEQEADRRVYVHDVPVTKQRAPLPDYPNDLNAMWQAEEKLLHEGDIFDGNHPRYRYAGFLYSEVTPREIQPCHADAKTRAIAFVKTIQTL